jgi:hypothetical protein
VRAFSTEDDFQVSCSVNNAYDLEWLADWVIDDQIGIDGPELYWAFGKVLSNMPNSGF